MAVRGYGFPIDFDIVVIVIFPYCLLWRFFQRTKYGYTA